MKLLELLFGKRSLPPPDVGGMEEHADEEMARLRHRLDTALRSQENALSLVQGASNDIKEVAEAALLELERRRERGHARNRRHDDPQ